MAARGVRLRPAMPDPRQMDPLASGSRGDRARQPGFFDLRRGYSANSALACPEADEKARRHRPEPRRYYIWVAAGGHRPLLYMGSSWRS